MENVYKILSREQWNAAKETGEFVGAPVDLEDGYIHLSAAHQVTETAAKHFAGKQDLLLVCLKAEQLGPELKWEVSRGGDLFPHLYRTLSLDEMSDIREIRTHEDGSHDLGTIS